MADEADDALDTDLEIPEIEEEQDGEAEVTLEGEEPAEQGDDPNESAVIRDFRKRERDKDRELRELRARVEQAAPADLPSDPGQRPQLAEFDYDDEKHAAALDAWVEKKIAFDQGQREVTQRSAEIEQRRRDGYQAAKVAQPIAGIDAAEERVFAQVDDMTRNALLHAKSPAVIAALDKYPDRLAAITAAVASGDAVEALMMIGELRGKAKIVTKTRKPPNPEEIASGTGRISHAGPDKREEQLEKAARKSGDMTELFKYRRDKRAAAQAN